MRGAHVCCYRAVAGALLTFIPSAAFAGGFAVQTESTHFLGSSLAGAAAGGALSSMFWNPAALGQFDGVWSEAAYSLHLPEGEIHAQPGSTLLALGLPADSGDFTRDALVPASYFSYQLSDDVVFGLSISAPFGLGTKAREVWAGQTMSRENKLETYNFTPSIGYRVAPGLTVGAGMQVEYIKAKLRAAFPFDPSFPNAINEGDDLALGFTAGALWEPSAATAVGLGFRSSIDHTFDGTLAVQGIGRNAAIADLETPEIVTLSLRQALTGEWTALATVQWTNWSRLDKLDTECKAAAPPFCPTPDFTLSSLALGWHDGWLFSGGLEHAYSKDLTLRGGAAYEISPIQNPEERPVQLPDSDRIWLSVGASYKIDVCRRWCDESWLELAYVHAFFEDASINRTENGVTLLANTEARNDVISIGFKTRWGGAGPSVEPLK